MILAKYLEELNGWYGSVNADNDWTNIQILKKMDKNLGLTFVPEPENEGNVCMASSPEVRDEYKQSFAPIDLLDYIYAVLHSPTYREKYKESLEIDLPRMPYPKEAETFWQLVALGGELRRLHLLEANKVSLSNCSNRTFPV